MIDNVHKLTGGTSLCLHFCIVAAVTPPP